MKFFKTHLFLLLALFCVLNPAYAQTIDDLFKKKMPTLQPISKTEFEAQTQLHQQTPGGDQSLAYEIRLPKDWEINKEINLSNFTLSEKILGDISEYNGPPRADALRSYFKIQALDLKFQITAQQWFLHYILSDGLALEGMRSSSDQKVEALHVVIDKDQAYVVYSIAQINDKRMILAQFFVPDIYWATEGPMVYESAKTYKLLHPKVSMIENMINYNFVDIASLGYPESWVLRAYPIKTIERMKVSFTNIREGEEKILDGIIDAELLISHSVSDIDVEIQAIKTKMQKEGIIISEILETKDDFAFNKNIEFGFIDVYKATDTKNEAVNYEVWIGVLALGEYYGILTMITPSRDQEYMNWSRNSAAFDSILKTINIRDGYKE
jgi:hypothetical protein